MFCFTAQRQVGIRNIWQVVGSLLNCRWSPLPGDEKDKIRKFSALKQSLKEKLTIALKKHRG